MKKFLASLALIGALATSACVYDPYYYGHGPRYGYERGHSDHYRHDRYRQHDRYHRYRPYSHR